MPDVCDIPSAATLQNQLALIETAISNLQGGASIARLTVTSPPQTPTVGYTTQVIFEPPLSDSTTVANTITALQTQQTYLINQLETLGYTYTGTALPDAAAAATITAATPTPQTPTPEPTPTPETPLDKPPELPEVVPVPPPQEPPPQSVTHH